MMVMYFLSRKNIVDRQFAGFYLLSHLNCGVLVLRLFLIPRLRFFASKLFPSSLFLFAYNFLP